MLFRSQKAGKAGDSGLSWDVVPAQATHPWSQDPVSESQRPLNKLHPCGYSVLRVKQASNQLYARS